MAQGQALWKDDHATAYVLDHVHHRSAREANARRLVKATSAVGQCEELDRLARRDLRLEEETDLQTLNNGMSDT